MVERRGGGVVERRGGEWLRGGGGGVVERRGRGSG